MKFHWIWRIFFLLEGEWEVRGTLETIHFKAKKKCRNTLYIAKDEEEVLHKKIMTNINTITTNKITHSPFYNPPQTKWKKNKKETSSNQQTYWYVDAFEVRLFIPRIITITVISS